MSTLSVTTLDADIINYGNTISVGSSTVNSTGFFISGNPVGTGVETIWVPAVAMIARTTNGAAAQT